MEKIEITTEIVSEICGYVRTGVEFQVAAIAAGFKCEQVIEMQIVLANAKDGIWREFADDVKKALAQFEVMQLMKINAEGGAKGAQWLLERKNPGKWEKMRQVSHEKKVSNASHNIKAIDIKSTENDFDITDIDNYLNSVDIEKIL